MNIRRPSDIRRKSDKRDSRKKILIAGGGVLCVLIIVGIAFVIRQSSLFLVRSIAVSGVPDVYGQQVLKNVGEFSTQHSFLFRFLGARNMIAWGGNEKEFLEANPDIKEMHIEKEYFKHAIAINVVGREKFGAWCHQGGETIEHPGSASGTVDVVLTGDSSEECYWFDADGVLFAKAPLVRSELFNRVFDSTGRSLTLRDTIMPDRLFKNLTRIFRLLEVARLNTKTVSLSDLALEEVAADSVSDPRVIFSLRFDPSFSLSAIDALKKSGEWKRLQYVNVTVENKVAYK
jgi:hypothetical protein